MTIPPPCGLGNSQRRTDVAMHCSTVGLFIVEDCTIDAITCSGAGDRELNHHASHQVRRLHKLALVAELHFVDVTANDAANDLFVERATHFSSTGDNLGCMHPTTTQTTCTTTVTGARPPPPPLPIVPRFPDRSYLHRYHHRLGPNQPDPDHRLRMLHPLQCQLGRRGRLLHRYQAPSRDQTPTPRSSPGTSSRCQGHLPSWLPPSPAASLDARSVLSFGPLRA
jgi:hypothetical protein